MHALQRHGRTVRIDKGPQRDGCEMIHSQATSRTTVPKPTALDPVLDFMRLLWNIEHGLHGRSKWMATAAHSQVLDG